MQVGGVHRARATARHARERVAPVGRLTGRVTHLRWYAPSRQARSRGRATGSALVKQLHFRRAMAVLRFSVAVLVPLAAFALLACGLESSGTEGARPAPTSAATVPVLATTPAPPSGDAGDAPVDDGGAAVPSSGDGAASPLPPASGAAIDGGNGADGGSGADAQGPGDKGDPGDMGPKGKDGG